MTSTEQIITWTLVHSLWIALATWLLVKVSSAFLTSSRIRRAVKICGLFLMCIGILFTLFNQIPSMPNTNGFWALSIEPFFYKPELTSIDKIKLWVSSNSQLICYLWFFGTLTGGIRFISNRNSLAKYRSSAIASTDKEFNKRADKVRSKLGINKNVKILISSLINSPMTIGIFKPVIYFPAGMISGFSSEELDTILLHEMAHVKRHDYLFNLFLVMIETTFFFNPIVHLMTKDLRREMEYVCDDEVLKGYDEIIYARALVRLQEITISNQVALAAKNNQSQFKNRIERMINSNNQKVSSKLGIVVIVFISLVISSAFANRSLTPDPIPELDEAQQEVKQDTLWIKDKEELQQMIKEGKDVNIKGKVLMLNGKPLKFIVGANEALAKSEKMMTEIRSELIKDGLLNENKEKITLMFQYSDVLNGKAALGDKYEKYKKILTRYFPVYDSFATTRVFRYQDKN